LRGNISGIGSSLSSIIGQWDRYKVLRTFGSQNNHNTYG